MQVLAVGKRCGSAPASLMQKFGTSSLNPLKYREDEESRRTGAEATATYRSGGRLQLVTNLSNARR